MELVWVNGALVERPEAKISVFDHGLVTGDGVFETLGVYQGVPLALGRHLARLEKSANGIGLTGLDLDSILSAVINLIESNSVADGKVRITVTGGESVLGSDRVGSQLSVIIATGPRIPLSTPAKIQVSQWPRNERSILAGLKTISYAENVAALAWAQAKAADEVIFGNTIGNLCEGSGSNIFIVVDGTVYTPPLSSGALGGITRDLIVENMEIEERDFPLEVLYSSDLEECFLTSSIREVQSISHIDSVKLSDQPGPITEQIAAGFINMIAKELKK